MSTALPPQSASLTQRRKRRAAAIKDDSSSKPTPDLSADLDPAAKSLKPSPVSPSSSPRSASLLTVTLTKLDVFVMILLLAAAAAVRMHRLTWIETVIFDEVHYINFTNHILRGEYFFDVNPVFGKLAVAYLAKLIGFDPSNPNVELGQRLPSITQAFAARMPSVIFGSLSVPVFYRICRLLRLSTFASVLGASFMLFDLMHVIQSRIAMVDSVLVFFTCLSMLCALCLWDAKNVVIIKRSRVSLWDAAQVLFYLIVTGFNCGLSLSTRWTAFATPLLIFTVSLFGVGPFCLEPLNFIELTVLYGSALMSYMGSFAVFLANVNKTGPGDNFMTPQFQSCLVGNAFAKEGVSACQKNMWYRIIELNKTIFQYAKGIRGNDKWGSSWFQWILNWRGALYYRESHGTEGKLSMIYVLMNPVMSLGINLLIAVFVGVLFFTVRYRKQFNVTDALRSHLKRGGLLFFGWLGSMLPTMVVFRSGPLYQYLPGLFFAQGLGAVGFDLVPRMGRPVVAAVLIAAMAGAFVFWSPWVYGTPLSQIGHYQRRWMSRWD